MIIAHFSDPHLSDGPLGGEPAAGLHRALGRALALDVRPDCIVITGDLADLGRPGEYQALREIVGRYPIPVHLVTGNHDSPPELVEEFAGTTFLGDGGSAHYAVDYPTATLIALDSNQPAKAAGRLGPEQLDWLDAQLTRCADRAAFVCLHHPPIPIGIPFVDLMGLLDGAELAEVIGRHPNVARVLVGHVHRPITAAFAGTVLSVAPSTYRQTELRLVPEQPMGYVEEPTAFLLHQQVGTTWVTHTVQVSHSAALLGGFWSGTDEFHQ